jgi:hypothetical protein
VDVVPAELRHEAREGVEGRGERRPSALRLAVAGAVIALAAAGCTSQPPLADTFSTPEAVASAVLDAVAAGDRARLDALALSEDEFKNHVWPDLPAARPERNLPMSYVWGDLHQKSRQMQTSALRRHAGKRYELRGVSFSEVTPYAGFRVHRAATFRVRDAAGQETDLRVCGSMIEQNGAWKVFSYVVDE